MAMSNRRTLLISLLSLALVVITGIYMLRSLRRMSAPSTLPVLQPAVFGKYDYQPPAVTPRVPDYQIVPEELGNLPNFQEAAKREFTPAQREALQSQHFFIAANLDEFYAEDPQQGSSRYDDWTHLYSEIGGPEPPSLRAPENAVFITTDFLLHVYHRLLEKEFEFIEQRRFYPKVKKITDTMLAACLSGYQSATRSAQKESFQRLAAFFAVPAALLDAALDFSAKELLEDNRADTREAMLQGLEKLNDKLPPESLHLARQELELVLAAGQVAPSPLLGKYQELQGLGFPEDYTQFAPRSHYHKNPVLRAYFRAMMWYGRMNFLLASPQLTRDAANITVLLEKTGLQKDWEDIYLATAFFVGESDDLGPREYRQALGEAAGGDISDDQVARLQAVLNKYRNPRVMGSTALGDRVLALSKEELQEKTKGFRLMGQRFTPDAFIFSFLTQAQEMPDPQTGERLPVKPTALMVMTLLGSQTATPLLQEWVDKNAADSRKVLKNRMEQLGGYFGKLTPADWTQNLYWSWLYTLKALFQEPRSLQGYPGFMKNPAWGRKNLQAALGSWTELKHDTLLYAKQVYAEMGNGEEEQKAPPVPKGYVEPNLEFFHRLIPLIKMTRDGLRERGLLDDEFLRRNDDFLEKVEFFRKIVAAQLQEEPITPADFEKLRLAPGSLRWVLSPLPGEEATENYGRAALVADVFTNVARGEILYEAVGIPNYIFVAVKDRNGARLTKGLVYSHYEFTGPLKERLTDEQWRAWNYTPDKAKLPAMAEWSRALIKGSWPREPEQAGKP
jgi:hypothetical protein